MGARILLHSPLSPGEAERRLREAVPPPAFLRRFPVADGPRTRSPRVVGRVGNGRFRLCVAQAWSRNSFKTVMRGRIIEDRGGSRIEAGFGLATWVRIFLVGYHGFLALMAVQAMALVIAGDAVRGGDRGDGILLLGVLLAMALFVRLLRHLGSRMPPGQDETLLRFLKDVLGAEPAAERPQ